MQEAEPTEVAIMPMWSRSLVFTNQRAYNIVDTMMKVRAFSDLFPESVQAYAVEACLSELEELKYVGFVDYEGFITDPTNGVITSLSIWFWEWGVEERNDAEFGGSVGTFDVSDYTTDESTVIDSEDEEDLIIAADVLRNLRNEDMVDEEMSDISDVIHLIFRD